MGQQVLAIACGTFAGTGTGTDASIGMSYMHALACLACTHDSIGILHASVTASSAQKARKRAGASAGKGWRHKKKRPPARGPLKGGEYCRRFYSKATAVASI